MAGTKARRPTTKIVEKWIRAGFGQGEGVEYKPFKFVRDVASPGLSNTVKSQVTGRIHHYITRQEYEVHLLAEYNPSIINIRERFALLPWDETQAIASKLGIRHPRYPCTSTPTVITTDLLLTKRHSDGFERIAVSATYSKHLTPQTLEKLLIERCYWKRRGISWFLATENNISKLRAGNLQFFELARNDALKHGISKSKIQLQYGVSAWSILLIKLDRPNLDDTNREAAALRRREENRNVLLSFLRDSPGKPRSEFAKRHSGSYSWMGLHDRTWLQSHLPKSLLGHGNTKGKAFKDWQRIDQAALLAVRQAAAQEFAKLDRPRRLTRSRLLSAAPGSVALLHRKYHRYPLAVAEAERVVETKKQFMRRAIRWALQKLAGQNLAISLHRLAPLASTPPKKLKEHRDYIIEVAAELDMTFDAQCPLAP